MEAYLPIAYVLLNTEIGSENKVLKAVKEVEGVQEAFTLWGIYDVIACVKAENMDKLTRIINDKMQLDKVHSKRTVILTEP